MIEYINKNKTNLPNDIDFIKLGPLRLRVLSVETSTESKQLLDRESFRDLLQSLSINLAQQEVAVSVLGRLGVVVADVHRRALRQIHTMPYSAAVRRTRRDSEAVREDALNFIQRRAVPSP